MKNVKEEVIELLGNRRGTGEEVEVEANGSFKVPKLL